MPNAACLHHLRWRKKKVEQFIIPPTHFRRNDYSIVDVAKNNNNDRGDQNINISTEKPEVTKPTVVTEEKPKITPPTVPSSTDNEPKFSALSLSSIRAKKSLEENIKGFVKKEDNTVLPTEPFTETEMLLQWTKYAQRLGSKGYKIIESLLLINDPKLDGTKISFELPNEGSKIEFEGEMIGLLGHLRGHLHNHDITIEVIVNESIEIRRTFTDQDRYNRLLEINPNIELLRTTFGLDVNA
ncbi:DNA polymerase III subunit gamma/tau [Flavobacterium aquiphilum]|uniref:DNA polymerase III subunit gamma/tau n=1 Tax=Flavobacterium aquiphilum TaxID=3003261 RepID=UPI002480599B|nr:DNA polymerase III subunit gamma/tau [Flavobacterium aquiphilum]